MREFPLNKKGFNPFGELLGLSFTGCREGRSDCSMQVDPRLMNPHRVLHGAVLYAMADTGMGAALYSALEDDESCATVEIKITYLHSVSAGQLECQTQLLRRGRRVAMLESEICNDGRLVAKASGTFAVLRSSS